MKQVITPGSHETLSTPALWGGVTDPRFHEPNNFRYLVHALGTAGHWAAAMGQKMDEASGITYDESWGDPWIDLRAHPERLHERITLSTSLIDSRHTGTFGDGGLIVGAPREDIVVTSPREDGTGNNNLDRVLAYAARHPILSGDAVLKQTNPNKYNEVVALGKTGPHPLKLEGFFVKTTRSGEILDKQLAADLHTHASRLGLPVVSIAEGRPQRVRGVIRAVLGHPN
jgi:hypothetical protein